MKNIATVSCVLIAQVVCGTTPSNLEDPVPPTLDELWDKSTRIVHGQIVAQKFFRQGYTHIIETTVSPKYSWKGFSVEDLDQTTEISFIEVSFMFDPQKLYDFEVGADYVVFLGDAAEPYDGYLHFTMPIKEPTPTFISVLDDSHGGKEFREKHYDIGRDHVREFLDSKGTLITKSNKTE